MSSSMTLVRTKADALDDAAPNATLPPELEVWHPGDELPGRTPDLPVRGFIARLTFTVPLGNSTDVEVWKRDDTQYRAGAGIAAWSRAGVLVGVTDSQEFFSDETGAADLYLRLVNVSGGNPVAVRMEQRT